MASRKTTCKAKARKRKRIVCPQITEYMRLVETGKIRSCGRQKKLVAYVRRVFAEEELAIDAERIERYSTFLKWFPFDRLFPWEWFLFTLFLCVFDKDGRPRWPDLVCFVGRGAGKNGFIAFIAFCLVTRVNGIRGYNVDICANSEEQAKTSFDDIWAILDGSENRLRFKKAFGWNKKEIWSKTTNSKIKYRTNSPTSKDGMRPGLVVFDEVHQYADWKNIKVFTTGLGKVAHPRRAFISSNGDVNEGVYDKLMERCDAILDGLIPDNGYLPFVCSLDDPEEVHDRRSWEKANPSLPYLPEDMVAEINKEYLDWVDDPVSNSDFMTKRMGIRQGDKESEVTSYDNLKRASRDIPDLAGWPCVIGLDMSAKNDFASAVALFRHIDCYYAIHHSWFSWQSVDRPRIKAPLREWEKAGLITIVDESEIHPSLIVDWIWDMQGRYDVRKIAVDDFRYSMVMRELREIGFDADRDGNDNVYKVRPSDHMRVHPIIHSAFNAGNVAWGEDPAMRWFTNNTKVVPWQNGNFKYAKQEAKSRKTDGFFAFVAAMCVRDDIPEFVDDEPIEAITW